MKYFIATVFGVLLLSMSSNPSLAANGTVQQVGDARWCHFSDGSNVACCTSGSTGCATCYIQGPDAGTCNYGGRSGRVIFDKLAPV